MEKPKRYAIILGVAKKKANNGNMWRKWLWIVLPIGAVCICGMSLPLFLSPTQLANIKLFGYRPYLTIATDTCKKIGWNVSEANQNKVLYGDEWACLPPNMPPTGVLPDGSIYFKPVIYLYPEKQETVQVKLKYQGSIDVSYPQYNQELQGWRVEAYPGGKLINVEDGKEYSYLFWEGSKAKADYSLAKGFVVAGADTKEFLQKALSEMGLLPKEYNEFIVFWLPKMQNNKYNLIYFAGKDYTDTATLEIAPQPDSILRVFMVFKPLNEKAAVEKQELVPFARKGFTVVEWGGTELQQ